MSHNTEIYDGHLLSIQISFSSFKLDQGVKLGGSLQGEVQLFHYLCKDNIFTTTFINDKSTHISFHSASNASNVVS